MKFRSYYDTSILEERIFCTVKIASLRTWSKAK